MSRSTNRRQPAPDVNLGPATDIVERLLRLPALSVEQGAVIAQTHPATVRRACAKGRLRAIRLSGGKLWRFTPGALLEWLGAADRVA